MRPLFFFNGVPAVCIGSITAHGGTITIGEPNVIISTSVPDATVTMPVQKIDFPKITFVDMVMARVGGNDLSLAVESIAQLQEQAPNEPIEENLEVTFESDFAMRQVWQLAKETASTTFYLFMHTYFFGGIPVIAFKKLYDDMSEGKVLNPRIVIVKNMYGRDAEFYPGKGEGLDRKRFTINDAEIRIDQKWVIEAIEGKEGSEGEKKEESIIKAKSMLFESILEEYGHYLDFILRFHYTNVEGDTFGDEGRNVKNYFLHHFNFLKDKVINFGTVTINGTSTDVILDFSDFTKAIQDAKSDFKGENTECFSAGKGNPILEEYGHFGIEEVLRGDRDRILDEIELSHLYLGNYMRDMSQVMSIKLLKISEEEKSRIKSVNPNAGFIEWLDVLKLKRSRMVEVIKLLAASQMKRVREGDVTEEIDGHGRNLVESQHKGLSKESVLEKLKETGKSIGLKAVQFSLDYYLFIKHYSDGHGVGGFDEEGLGVYRPEEHVDNPLGALVFDEIKKDYYYCEMDQNPMIGNEFGMKQYIRNHDIKEISPGIYEAYEIDYDNIGSKKSTGTDYLGGKLPTNMAYIERQLKIFYDKFTAAKTGLEVNYSYRFLGNALHVLEDYFAHTNFCEISLIKAGISVYPWVDLNAPELKTFLVDSHSAVDETTERHSASDYKYFDDEEAIKTYYNYKDSYKRLQPIEELGSFDVKDSFYFIGRVRGDKLSIYSARKKNYEGEEKYRVGLALGTRLSYREMKYIDQIPIVSGYFSSADMAHSLLHALEGAFEPTEITLEGLLMENDDEHAFMLEIADIIILFVLSDLAQSQKEAELEGKETGMDFSAILDMYRDFISIREIVITTVAVIAKKNIFYAVLSEVLIKTINATYTAINNLVKGVITDVIGLSAATVLAGQNMQLYRALGTNPSHTQLAKDHSDHPLHSLAAKYAMEAVKQVGEVLHKIKEDRKYIINGSQSTYNTSSDDFVDVFKSLMVHPSTSNWMNGVTQKWVDRHGQKIVDLHSQELSRKQMLELAEEIREAKRVLSEGVEAIYNRYSELEKEISQYLEKIRDYLGQLGILAKQVSDKVSRRVSRILKRMDINYRTIHKRTSKSLMKIKQATSEDEKDSSRKQMEKRLNTYNENQLNQLKKVEKHLKDVDSEIIRTLEEKIRKYYEELDKELEEKSMIQSNIYNYLKEYKPVQVKLLDDGIRLASIQRDITKKHISLVPQNHLAYLDKNKTTNTT